MKTIVIYPNYLPKVGGIETAVYELAKMLSNKGYKVIVAYQSAESNEVLFKYARVATVKKVLQDEVIKGDTCLIASNHERPKGIQADKWIQWIHSDYEKYNNLQLIRNPEVTQYVAVSKHCAEVANRMFDIDCKVIYNLVNEDFGVDVKKPLHFVTNSRISPEKGFYTKKGDSRMLKFAKLLKEKGVNFEWRVYGDNSHFPKQFEDVKRDFRDIEEVLFLGYKSDITRGLAQADYLVQLSDFEGCPYAILEALKMKVPCIVTDYLGSGELIQNGINGYRIPLNMENIDLDKIISKIPVIKEYKPLSTIEDWEEIL